MPQEKFFTDIIHKSILNHQVKYDPIRCDHCRMEFRVESRLKGHNDKIHGLDAQLSSTEVITPSSGIKWTQLIHLVLSAKGNIKFCLNLDIGDGVTRLIKSEIKKYENGSPTEHGMSFGPEDARFLFSILHNLPAESAFTSVQFVENYVVFKQNKKLLSLPKEAFDALKTHREIINDVLKYQRKNNLEVAELIIRLVIVHIFGDRPKSYKNLIYLEPSIIIGEYFNINEAKFREVIEYGYSKDNRILYSDELRFTILFIAEYNNFNVHSL